MTGKQFDEAIKSEFDDNGFIVVKNFFDPAVVAKSLQAYEAFADAVKSGERVPNPKEVVTDLESDDLKYVESLDYYVPAVRSLIDNRLLDLCARLFDHDVRLGAIELHDKIPFRGTETPPHQDNFYFCLDPADAVTVYIPLEEHSVENGALSYVKGTHKTGTLEHMPAKTRAFSSHIAMSDVPGGEDNVVRLDLKPGDISVHHANVVHFAANNESPKHRRAISVRILATNAEVSPVLRERYLKNRRYNREEPVAAEQA